jgi:hypothetical protein
LLLLLVVLRLVLLLGVQVVTVAVRVRGAGGGGLLVTLVHDFVPAIMDSVSVLLGYRKKGEGGSV